MTIKIVNVSGESREYRGEDLVYEFPYPAIEPTEVPDELGKKLLATEQFALPGTGASPIPYAPVEMTYEEQLIALPKIGKKTAKDIMKVYPTVHDILAALANNDELPFDDDVVQVLSDHFGGN